MNGTATESAITRARQPWTKQETSARTSSEGQERSRDETAFPKGEYAMYIDGPWAYPTYTAEKFTTPA
jgi:maltose-binding protein MalE